MITTAANNRIVQLLQYGNVYVEINRLLMRKHSLTEMLVFNTVEIYKRFV